MIEGFIIFPDNIYAMAVANSTLGNVVEKLATVNSFRISQMPYQLGIIGIFAIVFSFGGIVLREFVAIIGVVVLINIFSISMNILYLRMIVNSDRHMYTITEQSDTPIYVIPADTIMCVWDYFNPIILVNTNVDQYQTLIEHEIGHINTQLYAAVVKHVLWGVSIGVISMCAVYIQSTVLVAVLVGSIVGLYSICFVFIKRFFEYVADMWAVSKHGDEYITALENYVREYVSNMDIENGLEYAEIQQTIAVFDTKYGWWSVHPSMENRFALMNNGGAWWTGYVSALFGVVGVEIGY